MSPALALSVKGADVCIDVTHALAEKGADGVLTSIPASAPSLDLSAREADAGIDVKPPLALEVTGADVAIDIKPSLALSALEADTHQGLTITYRDLNYHVPSNAGKKGERAYLLKGVSGFFRPGEMSALMGPSGSGKTTLLDVLAGRKTAGVIEGGILFSGYKPTRAFLRRYTGYVEQFDTLIPTLSVHEMLMYTAELKRSMSEPMSSKQDAVAALLERLALTVCKDVSIGDSGNKGISGGQAKRVNIGIALITNPRVLFLDEPTSGLDSYTANEVMTVVKTLVKDGTTICATIHSPTSYCFSLFDSLTMLIRGSVVYFGTQGRAPIDFVRGCCGDVKDYTEGYNDAEYLVELVTEADRHGRGDQLALHYANSSVKADNDAVLQKLMVLKEDMPAHIEAELNTTQATVTPWWWGIKTLAKYRTTKNYTNGAFMGPRIMDKVLISLIVMTLYWKSGHKMESSNVANLSAVLFMWTVLPAFGAASYIPSLVLERNLFARERNDGLYYTWTYLVYKIIEEVFLAMLVSAGVAAYIFYGVHFSGQFILFWLVYWITLCNGIALAYFIAAISPNLDVANALLPTYCVTLIFFGGFIMMFRAMPNYWKWYSWIDFMRYSWGALMVNQWEDQDLRYSNGLTVLQVYSFDSVSKWTYVGFEAIFFIVFFLLALTTMTLRKYQSR